MNGHHDDAQDRLPRKAVPGKAPNMARIEDAARRRLGHNLRLLYTSVLDQPLPERFTQLLDLLSERPPTQEDRGNREGSR